MFKSKKLNKVSHIHALECIVILLLPALVSCLKQRTAFLSQIIVEYNFKTRTESFEADQLVATTNSDESFVCTIKVQPNETNVITLFVHYLEEEKEMKSYASNVMLSAMWKDQKDTVYGVSEFY